MLLNKERFDIYNSQTLLRVVVKNPDEVKSAYRELKNSKLKITKFFDQKFPRKLHYGTKMINITASVRFY